MNFENEFEHHKIPEFYEFYFDYSRINSLIRNLKQKRTVVSTGINILMKNKQLFKFKEDFY
jgi:hypothetical protein